LELMGFIEQELISNLTAKSVLKDMIDSGERASKIIKDKNLAQISDNNALEIEADKVIKDNPKIAADFRLGKVNAIMFLVGQVMRRTGGKANPKSVQEILKRRLSDA
ncbi:MAG: Asp-tRNA(Asn)/Glu-tRNA(Gln) amidotransferase GatCAB subunit B, partial [Candidatus Omnitrophota bacterium]